MEETTNPGAVTKRDPRPLPKIEDLYKDPGLAKQQNELSRLLNHPPKPEWLKPHPMATREVKDAQGNKKKVPVLYMPIGIIEYLAASIFIKTRTEVKQVQLIANSVQVTVRVWVLDPVTQEWDWQEGVGAAPIRTDKGKAATDFAFVQDSAVQTATPAAKTYAEKDAFEKFGAIFGRDMNRAEDMVGNYHGLDKKFVGPEPIPEELIAVIEEAELDALQPIWRNNNQYHNNPEFLKLLNNRREQLNAGTAQTTTQ